MDTSQLENLLYRHSATRNIFGGVIASDMTPHNAHHKCYIINLDKYSEAGSHWVAIYFNQNGIAEYFDSYGLPPHIKQIREFLERNCVSWYSNPKQLQHVQTAVCGQYCAFFLIMRCSGVSMKRIISQFSSTHFLQNDRFVRNFIFNMSKMLLPLYTPPHLFK